MGSFIMAAVRRYTYAILLRVLICLPLGEDNDEALILNIACLFTIEERKKVSVNIHSNTLIRREKSTSYFDLPLTFVHVHYRSNAIRDVVVIVGKGRDELCAFAFDSNDSAHHLCSVNSIV